MREPRAETCFASADLLPVRKASGFRLVNEGAAKAVRKLGWLSTRLGDTLDLGPVAQATCGAVVVHLGDLRTWRPDAGAFQISCIGCECSCHRRSTDDLCHTAGLDRSFPLVQTSSVGKPKEKLSKYNTCRGKAGCQVDEVIATCADPDDPLKCATVSINTEFSLTKRAPRDECLIRLTHISMWPARPLNSSRVRIDTLSFEGVEARGCVSKGR